MTDPAQFDKIQRVCQYPNSKETIPGMNHTRRTRPIPEPQIQYLKDADLPIHKRNLVKRLNRYLACQGRRLLCTRDEDGPVYLIEPIDASKNFDDYSAITYSLVQLASEYQLPLTKKMLAGYEWEASELANTCPCGCIERESVTVMVLPSGRIVPRTRRRSETDKGEHRTHD